jgi:hypothetical protein
MSRCPIPNEVPSDVRGVLGGLVLDTDREAEIDADLRSVEAQLDSPKPKKGIVRESLSSARTVLEGVAAKEAAAGAEHIPGLIDKLEHAISLLT